MYQLRFPVDQHYWSFLLYYLHKPSCFFFTTSTSFQQELGSNSFLLIYVLFHVPLLLEPFVVGVKYYAICSFVQDLASLIIGPVNVIVLDLFLHLVEYSFPAPSSFTLSHNFPSSSSWEELELRKKNCFVKKLVNNVLCCLQKV